MFVSSDEEDQDEDGTVDYKYGLARNHRLLGAITEVSTYLVRDSSSRYCYSSRVPVDTRITRTRVVLSHHILV